MTITPSPAGPSSRPASRVSPKFVAEENTCPTKPHAKTLRVEPAMFSPPDVAISSGRRERVPKWCLLPLLVIAQDARSHRGSDCKRLGMTGDAGIGTL